MTSPSSERKADREKRSPLEAQVTIEIDPTREIGRVEDDVFGHFLESNFFHNIDGGVFDEGHPLALTGPEPAAGLRADVIDACRDLGVPVVRWPGGNFTSGYHWPDGIGPRERRPRRLDLAWRGEESNRFGTDEFLTWCELIGAAPYLVHSARSVDEAVRWVEYVNHAGRTSLRDARAANGHPDPYRVRLWGIGNEAWGPWQMGYRSARAYAADAREHATFMRRVDPDIRLVAVGPRTPEDVEWIDELLGQAGAAIDLASLHLYGASLHRAGVDDYDAVVAQPRFFEEQIVACSDAFDAAARRAGLARPPAIALDEWNIRHLEPAAGPEPQPGPRGGATTAGDAPVPETGGRLRVNRYSSRTLADALFYAGVFHALHRQSGLQAPVRLANTVNLVNANALLEVRGEGVIRSATYHVWNLYQRLGRRVVEVRLHGPTRTVAVRQGAGDLVSAMRSRPAELPALDVIATTADNGRVHLAIINRDRRDPVIARIASAGELVHRAHVAELGAGIDDVWAVNGLDRPDRVALVDRGEHDLADGCHIFPPHSITALSLATERRRDP